MLLSTRARQNPKECRADTSPSRRSRWSTEYAKKQAKPNYRPEILEEAKTITGIEFDVR